MGLPIGLSGDKITYATDFVKSSDIGVLAKKSTAMVKFTLRCGQVMWMSRPEFRVLVARLQAAEKYLNLTEYEKEF